MSSDQPRVVESRPSALTSNPVHEAEDEKDHGTVDRPLEDEQAVNNFKAEIEKARDTSTKAEISTHVIIRNSSAGQADTNSDNVEISRVVRGGPLLAVYTLADTAELEYKSSVTFAEVSSLGDEAATIDSKTFSKVKEGDALAAEAMNRHREFDIPIFVCTLSFPMMPTFLHVFEPRYRLMIRRALEGDRTFGMVLPQRPRTANDTHFVQYGTLLRIVNAEYFADGRSLIETSGISRFRITRHGILDGYLVGKIERIDDMSIAEEEDLEATETQRALERYESAATHQSEDSTMPRPITTTPEDLSTMPTSDLLTLGVSFVQRMRQQSVPWLAQRMLAIYGECPNDPALFPWWFASILPAKEYEKYKLLETRSVRERLKICCGWILEWESSRW
ncbi:ATP-dependent protease La domain-containing protein [Colletotrichum orchidophilum]|uniref:ATP-dependent protease La domain-containing protein n=1 Tax=Colletotrichum orchidophilum TaxID=1209926 RepID=A0A1G4AUN0_9PEZI|nr:ATP-dependent protease La domain-containing protein [Colletotrichum orchidophilum]OHE92762.1 ATP-dependent protease La domain-containing protein [Colletotrichum orchidophilum]